MESDFPPSWHAPNARSLAASQFNAAVDFDCPFYSENELSRYRKCARHYVKTNGFEGYTPDTKAAALGTVARVLKEVRHVARVRTVDTVGISFATKRVSETVWVIQEDDLYKEHPLIYVKLLPKVSVILLCDTGTDAPTEKHRSIVGTSTHLRHYLENVPIKSNGNRPFNPSGKLTYFIIQTHCHYDHIAGIPQFSEGGTTQILASAAGRDFIESDLAHHSLLPDDVATAPYYKVTKWAQAFERLTWPLSPKSDYDEEWNSVQKATTDLGITVLHTPGHTPDELAWYDHEEMHLYVGDSFYREGEEGMPIIFPPQGNFIEWVFSMQKLAVFVRGENARGSAKAELASAESEEGWELVAPRVKVSCAHTTTAVDGAEILAELEGFSFRVFAGKVPVIESKQDFGEPFDLWREKGEKRTPMSILAPRRLMEEAREFFGHDAAREQQETWCSGFVKGEK